jgi:hypothetical protein
MSEDSYYSTDATPLETYQADTATSDDLYQASSEAQQAGDSYAASELNAASVDAGGDANTAWDAYTAGDTSSATAEDTSSYDPSAGDDSAQAFSDYIGG